MARRFHLGRTARRLTLLVHLIAALGWLGIDVVFGVLAVTGFIADEPSRIAVSYIALDTFAVPLLLIFGLSALGTGLLLSLGSGWGLVRYWWVTAKLALNLLLSSLVLVLLRPRLADAIEQAARVDPTLRDRLTGIDSDLLYPAFVSGTALLAASLIAVFKPWGRTPWASRARAAAAARQHA